MGQETRRARLWKQPGMSAGQANTSAAGAWASYPLPTERLADVPASRAYQTRDTTRSRRLPPSLRRTGGAHPKTATRASRFVCPQAAHGIGGLAGPDFNCLGLTYL